MAQRGAIKARIATFEMKYSLLQPVFYLELPELVVSIISLDLQAQDRMVFEDDVGKGPVVV